MDSYGLNKNVASKREKQGERRLLKKRERISTAIREKPAQIKRTTYRDRECRKEKRKDGGLRSRRKSKLRLQNQKDEADTTTTE